MMAVNILESHSSSSRKLLIRYNISISDIIVCKTHYKLYQPITITDNG